MADYSYLFILLTKVIFAVTFAFFYSETVRSWMLSKKGVCKCTVKLHGKVAVVTGGNSGIGLETARDLARRGAQVIIASRDVKKSEDAVSDIIATTNNQNVHHMELDLGKFKSIKTFVDNFNKKYERLDILVNNAGCAGLKQATTENGIEKIMQINYVGPFLLTHLLLDKLKASKPSRIVIVSSMAHNCHKLDPDDLMGMRPLSFWSRYANSKVCNVLWAKALAKHLPEGITANALEPGLAMTNIFHRYSELRKKILHFVIRFFFKSAEEGAQTSIHLCVAPYLDGISGQYFKDCKIATPNKTTLNKETVDLVWEKTMQLIEGAI